MNVTDSQSGFRAFRRSAIEGLELTAEGMEFASEMLIQAGRAGLRVIEVPTVYSVRVGESKLNTLRDGIRHLRQILVLAPQLLLLVPGGLLVLLGAAIQGWSLFEPAGIQIGSLQWQPIFLSGLALIVGTQMLLAGFAVTERFADQSESRRNQLRTFGFLLPLGAALVIGGVATDLYLLLRWLASPKYTRTSPALAGLASSALITGISVLGFYLVYPLVIRAKPWTSRYAVVKSWEAPSGISTYVIRKPPTLLGDAAADSP